MAGGGGFAEVFGVRQRYEIAKVAKVHAGSELR
jgi:hypothetical protein